MMNHPARTPSPRSGLVCTTVIASLAGLCALPVGAQTAGRLLFVQPGVQIIDVSGQARPAIQGDVLQVGERLVTPNNAISQVKLPDGSLVGMRPGTELKLDTPPGIDRAQQVLTLVQGNVRIVGAELNDSRAKPSGLTLQSGGANLQVGKADLESAVVGRTARPGTPGPAGASDAGSYNRLLAGSGSLRTGSDAQDLKPREVSFVSPGSARPTVLASVTPGVFGGLPAVGSGVARIEPKQDAGAAPKPAPGGPTLDLTTSTLTTPGIRDLPVPVAAPAISTAPVFSPITTTLFPTGTSTTLAPTGTTRLDSALTTTVSPVTTLQPVTTTTLIQPTTTLIQPTTLRLVCAPDPTGRIICK